MAEVVLITGGNLGDVASTMERCNRMIEQRLGEIVKISTMVESEPWGFSAQERFLNQALVVNTTLSPMELLQATQQIELELGRTSKSIVECNKTPTYSSRTIDIDILFYDDQVIRTSKLAIPHPLLHEREFVLEPLCQIDSERIHPILGLSIGELKNSLKSDLK